MLLKTQYSFFKLIALLLLINIVVLFELGSALANETIQNKDKKTQYNSYEYLEISQYDSLSPVGKYLSIYKDPTNIKTMSEIIDLNDNDWVHSNKSIPSLGYQKSTIWFRLKVFNNLDHNLNYLINIANSNLDEINIYIFNNGNLLDSFREGDRFPFKQRETNNRNFITPIDLKPNGQYDIYVSVFNLGTLQVPFYLQSQKTVASESQVSLLLWGIYFGLTMIMVLYNFILFISIRDSSYFLFSIFILANVLFHACLHGFGFQYVWPNHEEFNDWLMPTSNALLYVFGGLFISQFVGLKMISTWQYRVMMFIVCFAFFMALVSPFIPYQNAVVINTISGFPFAVASVLASVTALRQGNQAVRFFLVSWVIFIIAAFILAANKMGVIPRNIFTENGLQIGNALSILFISLALADRINIEKKQRILADKETLRLEREARSNKEKQFELDLQAKETELKVQNEIILAREEVLLAKSKSQTKSRFLATMSHEIRTPLNGVLGMSDMLMETSLDENQKDILGVIRRSGRSLLNIINDILDFSKIEAGKMKMEYRIFDVRELHTNIIKNFDLLAKDKAIKLLCELKDDVPRFIKSDSNRIEQVLSNLIGNALKFTDKGSIKLVVSLDKDITSENSSITIKTEIVDTGIGLTEDQLVNLFKSFSQADESTTRKYGGSGLGLSISKRIIELLGGQIGAISENQEGANFWFTIPSEKLSNIEIREYSTSSEISNKEDSERSSRNQLNGLNILIAEDNRVNQMVIKGMLKRLGVKCSLVENGKEAVNYVTKHYDQINGVLMDCEMPVMDGYDATMAIRNWEEKNRKSSIPIIAVTAHALDDMVNDSIRAGMNAHISKPVDKQILTDTLVKHLS